jgi:hypothetical protein
MANHLHETIEEMVHETLGLPDPPHRASDPAKVCELVAAMRDRGWDGPPVVVDDGIALTGSHRLAAVMELATAGTYVRVPLVDLAKVCARFGVDWEVHRAEQGGNWYDAARALPDRLPREVVEYLGLDLH